MRLLLLSLLLLATTVGYWFGFASPQEFVDGIQAADGLAIRDLCLLLLSVFVAGEAILGRRPMVQERTITAETKNSTALDEVKLSEQESLRQALRESEQRNATLEKTLALSGRSETVNSEIAHFLAVLQEKGRLVDFLMDDIAPYSDAQVGAVARVVHQGCSTVLKEYFSIEAIYPGREGDSFRLEKSYSPRKYRLLGAFSGGPPFEGTIVHRGWQTTGISLPRLNEKAPVEEGALVIAPTQVQVS